MGYPDTPGLLGGLRIDGSSEEKPRWDEAEREMRTGSLFPEKHNRP